MEILPVQVAYRGFDHGLTLKWIYRCIESSIREGKVQRPVHVLEPGGTIPVYFAIGLIEYWKHQYDRHVKVDIPRELWAKIDGILGLQDP